MTQMLMGMIVLATVAAPDDLVEVAARIAADRLVVGESYEIVIDFSLRDGYSASGAGIPAPLLQIEVPSCVVLKGKASSGPGFFLSSKPIRAGNSDSIRSKGSCKYSFRESSRCPLNTLPFNTTQDGTSI